MKNNREKDYFDFCEDVRLRYGFLSYINPEHELLAYCDVSSASPKVYEDKRDEFCERFSNDPKDVSIISGMEGYASCLDIAITRIALGIVA